MPVRSTDQQSGPDDAIRPLAYEDEDNANATAIGRLDHVDQINSYGEGSVFRSDDEPVRKADERRSEARYLPASDGYP